MNYNAGHTNYLVHCGIGEIAGYATQHCVLIPRASSGTCAAFLKPTVAPSVLLTPRHKSHPNLTPSIPQTLSQQNATTRPQQGAANIPSND
jgi:hypothetical protein